VVYITTGITRVFLFYALVFTTILKHKEEFELFTNNQSSSIAHNQSDLQNFDHNNPASFEGSDVPPFLKLVSNLPKTVIEKLAHESAPENVELDINDVLENYDISADCSELASAGLDATLFIQGNNVVISVGASGDPCVIYQLDRDVDLSISCRYFANYLSNIELISDELIVQFANATFADVIKHIESIH
jgi:hypothetical protein